jgi:tRNA pseudouridine55 synthase
MYSALKVGGRKLVDLAREGVEVEREARMVEIMSLSCDPIPEEDGSVRRYRLDVSCSKGTYIRTLCADIGEKLGCGGTMKSLVRSKVSEFILDEALTLGRLQKLKDEGRLLEAVMPVDGCFAECPALHVKEQWRKLLENGNSFFANQTLENKTFPAGQWVRIYREEGSFAGIYAYDAGKKWYSPIKMFLAE